MSLYPEKLRIDGVVCSLAFFCPVDGTYLAVFDRKDASLEDIEAIHWEAPTITGEGELPAGHSYEVADITYANSDQCYHVTLRDKGQRLGDMTAYQAEIARLEAALAEKT